MVRFEVAAGFGHAMPVGLDSRLESALRGVLRSAFVSAAADGDISLRDVAELARVDPMSLEDGERVDLLRAFERVRAMVEGAQQRALAAVVEATRATGLEGEAARHEVGAALRLAPSTASARTRVAELLTSVLPATLEALCAGEITYLHARCLAESVGRLDPEVAAAVEAAVLPAAREQSLAEFRRAVQAAILAADPQGAAQRSAAAAARRSITRYPQPDALEGWWLTLPAHEAGLSWETLTGRARQLQAALRARTGIDPGLGALRVDALIEAILGHRPAAADATAADATAADATAADATAADASTADASTGAGGAAARSGAGPLHEDYPPAPDGPALDGPADVRVRAGLDALGRCRCGGAQTVAVVLDLPTLLGMANNPGEIPGYGPVPATVARELAADRDWERWTVHPQTRALLDRSPYTYRPGRRLRGFVAAAHRTCGFPGCSRAAEGCDTDHRITFGQGGRTVVVNLGPLCRQHHNAKTHGRWRLTYDEHTDTWHWRSPLGKTYRATTNPPLRT